MSFEPLVTGRLVLRTLTAADAPAILRYRSLPEIARYQSFEPSSLADVERFLAAIAPVPDVPGTWFQLGIERRAEGDLAGDCGLRFPADDPAQVEFGITLAPGAQGRGYAAEALGAVFAYVFGTLGKHRVYGSVDPGNRSSIALMERLGLRREAHFVESLRFKGRWADDVVYALLEREWHVRPTSGPTAR